METTRTSPADSEPSSPPQDTGQEPYVLRQRIGLIAGPVVALALLLLPTPEGLSVAAWHVAAVGSLMAVWWMTEALPLAVTSLLPLVLLPVLGAVSIRETAAPYANPLIFLFMGGFMLALAMERWHLHRRIALTVIRLIGTRPTGIIAGFMVSAAFLSMWISNTATAMMMLPVGLSVIELVRRPDAPEASSNFAVVLMLAIAYACSVGGLGTLIGTPTNALLAAFLEESYGFELSFARWLLIGLPLVVLGVVIVFVVLTRVVYPIALDTLPGGRAYLREELNKLGPMQRAEKQVAIVFGLVALLWITRPLLDDVVPGLSDAGIAMAGAVVLFVLPVDWKQGVFVLNWDWARRLPWGVLLLFGGGLSLASAISATGLADWIGAAMEGLAAWPVVLITGAVVVVIVLLTELTSNTATAAAFLPVLASIALGIGQDPLLLLVPATLAASCAFMLPVATPPNAIVYGSSFITIPQMVRAGAVLNVIFVLVVTALAFLLLPILFGVELGTLPAWVE
jgi:sodium-dependent dicarboxylate transporter 2/3/5